MSSGCSKEPRASISRNSRRRPPRLQTGSTQVPVGWRTVMMKVNYRRCISAAVTLLFFELSELDRCFGQYYVIQDLGTPTNSGYSDPHGINGGGAVAGEWSDAAFQRGFLYRNSLASDTGTLGGQYAIAYGINDQNVVVGESSKVGGGSFDVHAFLWTNGVMNDLGTLAGSYSSAKSVNASGEAVGESSTSIVVNSPTHAVWYHGGMKTDLGMLGGDYSSARGINDNHVIVGETSVVNGSVTNVHAFIYSSGTMQDLGTLGGNYSTASAINNAGKIVGESSVATGDTHAFVYTSGAMLDLGTLGGNYSTASAINTAGLVVGYAFTASGEAHGFLFNGTAMLDLNSMFSGGSVCTNLISADGINDAGQITGSGFTAAGAYHAFLLTPGLELFQPLVTNGQFRVTVSGTPGQKFAMLASTDLQTWISLGTNTFSANTFEWTDPSGAAMASRFYRAMLVP